MQDPNPVGVLPCYRSLQHGWNEMQVDQWTTTKYKVGQNSLAQKNHQQRYNLLDTLSDQQCLKVWSGSVFYPYLERPRLRPVLPGSNSQKPGPKLSKTGPQRFFAVFCGCKTSLDQLWFRPVQNRSQTGLIGEQQINLVFKSPVRSGY